MTIAGMNSSAEGSGGSPLVRLARATEARKNSRLPPTWIMLAGELIQVVKIEPTQKLTPTEPAPLLGDGVGARLIRFAGSGSIDGSGR